ncbi:hypothetical protein KII91_00740 [Leuconostoc gelidum subsp. gelidum]|uniref:hypothetical protein n=1 Tax=Leuconostoc gelidum TaxID=1244 RepID=UPI001CC36F79|nr:hypothetical protein [Leuconostoc gelidum]MBZ5977868.1 hypothetical protein [Leuconostoc gelidum subsp. gelidum]MBZ6001238.1 hypothetical protein [Leuconostoc gelidum subsp. gelidum]
MKKSTNINRPLRAKINSRFPQLSTAIGATIGSFLPLVASADVQDAAKQGGNKAATVLFVVLIIVAGISLLIAMIMRSFGSESLAQKSNMRVFHTLLGVFGGALVGMLLTWIWAASQTAGGGNVINWPF